MSDMFAAVAERIGGPEVIRFTEHRPKAQPAKGELRIRVAAAGINPIDCARRGGYGRRMMKLLGAAEFPLVLGSDFAGVVDVVGAGVTGWQPGEAVFGCKAVSRAGTHAEFVCAPAKQVLRLPGTMTPEQAATVPYSFVTACRLVEAGTGGATEDVRGLRVLIHGGLGSVGSFAARILAHSGAVVDISDREPTTTDVAARGASSAVDLSQQALATQRGTYNAILNCARFQDEELLFPLLKRGGRYATVVHPLIASIDEFGWIRGGLRARAIWRRQADRVRACGGESYRWVLFKPESKAFEMLDRMAGLGLLKPEIAEIVQCHEAARAHALMAVGVRRGKIILQMP